MITMKQMQDVLPPIVDRLARTVECTCRPNTRPSSLTGHEYRCGVHKQAIEQAHEELKRS